MQNRFGAIVVAALLFFIGLYPGSLRARHGQLPPWVNESKDGFSNSCCGEKDCMPVISVSVLQTGVGYADVVIDGQFGVVFEHSVRTIKIDCSKDDSRPFVCTRPQFKNRNGEYENCEIENADGTVHLVINTSCIRCVLIPMCEESYS